MARDSLAAGGVGVAGTRGERQGLEGLGGLVRGLTGCRWGKLRQSKAK